MEKYPISISTKNEDFLSVSTANICSESTKVSYFQLFHCSIGFAFCGFCGQKLSVLFKNNELNKPIEHSECSFKGYIDNTY